MENQETNEKINKLLNSVDEGVDNQEKEVNNDSLESLKTEIKKDWRWWATWILVALGIVILLFVIIKQVNGLDKNSLCSNIGNLTFQECDDFWNLLTQNRTINQTIISYTNTTIFVNGSGDINIDILKEKNRHDEAIAKIEKGIIDNNGSQSIITGDFVKKSEFTDSLNAALLLYTRTSELPEAIKQKIAEQFGTTNLSTLTFGNNQNSNASLNWYETPGFIIVVVILILGGVIIYNKFFKKKKVYNHLQQELQTQQQAPKPKPIIVVMPETKPEIKNEGE